MLEAGTEPIPGHRLRHRRGKGGRGEVWEADLPDGSTVALKFLDCRTQSSTLVSSEIRVLVKLRELHHPNIVRLLDVFATQQFIVLKMELADGNLHELREVYLEEAGRPFPRDHLLDLITQAAAGLDFLAEQPMGFAFAGCGMQHCDVKPSNLLISADGLKVADFGLCVSSLSRTYLGGFMGTPPYAAPELYEGRVATHTDQYALAVTYCELAANKRVTPRVSGALPAAPPPVDLSGLRPAEASVVARALEPRWTDRWPSCKAFVAALREASEGPRKPAGRRYGSRELSALPRK